MLILNGYEQLTSILHHENKRKTITMLGRHVPVLLSACINRQLNALTQMSVSPIEAAKSAFSLKYLVEMLAHIDIHIHIYTHTMRLTTH